MKKLIISADSYLWVKHTAGLIMSDPADFELIFLYEDNRTIFWCRNLCRDAIYEQRKFDMFKLGRALGITKVANLNYNFIDFNSTSFIPQMILYLTTTGIKEVYYQHTDFLNKFFVPQANITSYAFGTDGDASKKICLNKEIYQKKIELKKLMVGINNTEQWDLYNPIERFY